MLNVQAEVYFFANVTKKCISFFRKAHLIMQQYFHMIGCNLTKKAPFELYKQTKNRNETGSNLNLGTRLTVLSKCLGRKRCCDATPDRCLEACRRCLTIFASHC